VFHYSQPYGHSGYGHPGQYFYGYSVSNLQTFFYKTLEVQYIVGTDTLGTYFWSENLFLNCGFK